MISARSNTHIALLVAVLLGCASNHPVYPVRTIESYPFASSEQGLLVSVRPISREEAEKYFGKDLREIGLLAVEFAFQNNSQSASYVVRPEACTIVGANAPDTLLAQDTAGKDFKEEHEEPGAVATAVGGTAVAVGAATLSAPILLATGLAFAPSISNKVALGHALRRNQLGAHTLSPGATARGMSYYKLEALGNESEGIARVLAKDLVSRETVIVRVPFTLEPK